METKNIIQVEVPKGKKAEWVDGVLTLVDEQGVMERIKTFEDACNRLGKSHQLVYEHELLIRSGYYGNSELSRDLQAYLILRIIAAALNEGWKYQILIEDECKFYPYFVYYTQEEFEEADEEMKSQLVYIPKHNVYVACAGSNDGSSYANAGCCYRLAFKSQELAEYAGKQFLDIFAEYAF